MKYLTFKGTDSHPESFRLAPHPRLVKGEVVEVTAEAAAVLLKCDGVKATTKPKTTKAD